MHAVKAVKDASALTTTQEHHHYTRTLEARAEASEKPALPLALKGGGLRRVPKGESHCCVGALLFLLLNLDTGVGTLSSWEHRRLTRKMLPTLTYSSSLPLSASRPMRYLMS